jgi:hypothetical protein
MAQKAWDDATAGKPLDVVTFADLGAAPHS